MNRYKGKDYKKMVFVPEIKEIAKLLAKLSPESEMDPEWSEDDRQFAAVLKLIHDSLIHKEMQRRPSQMILCQGQRDGIDCMNYFFDLINDCAGYTEKYYEEIGAGKLSYKQMVKKYRKERDDGAIE